MPVARTARRMSFTLGGLALALLLGATAALGAINSNLSIEGGASFVLGGDQPGAFTVTGENTGAVAVEVRAGDALGAGERRFIATIAPGDRFEQDFARGEAAILRNLSASETARLKLRITGTTRNLGMAYEEKPGAE